MDDLYLYCAIFGSAFVIVQFFASMLFGGGDDVGVDGVGDSVGLDLDGDGSVDVVADGVHSSSSGDFLRVFSVRTASAGIAFFGLTGLALRDANLNEFAKVGIAIAVGFATLFGVYFLIRSLSSFNADGSIRTNTAVQAEGTVYLTIPAGRKGAGKAMIVQQGRTLEYEAMTDSEFDLVPGTPIVVKELLGPTILLVTKR
ncbi:MAG: hypothetical protein PHO46_06235 [Thermoguttaceae bacterium]|jgi:hypothetical protein|nr:hypothetical protein [Thermoguttaceae bacterium]